MKLKLILDFGFAWISILLSVLLSVIYLLRKLLRTSIPFKNAVVSVNKHLRKSHKWMGIALIISALIHGLASTRNVFSVNFGTGTLILAILLGINWMIRKRFFKKKGWIWYHRVLTIVFLIGIVLHIVEVGGIQIDDVLPIILD
jgi:hypothetical protein